jgi:NAD(P)-dependent dehydrogenase (short-subunit alcohol dehydrogenase family)
MEFEQQTVVVTGGAGTLGQAVAHAFLQKGACVVLMDRGFDGIAMKWAVTNGNVMFAPLDLLDRAEVVSSIGNVMALYGRIDVVCHTAGGFSSGETVHNTAEATWKRMYEINVQTLLNVSEPIIPHMIESSRGKIVTVGALSAQKGTPNTAAYAASKSMVVRISESMSSELREYNINVNCVLPSIINSPANRLDMPDADPHRWVQPSDVAEVMVFLSSGAARAIHGVALPVTGLS